MCYGSRKKADEIAKWGYNAVALDVYGKGVVGASPAENAALKQPFLNDRTMLKQRLLKGYEAAVSRPSDKIVILGFGFGGLCALDLARYVKADGAISVYGHYDCPPGVSNESIEAKVLILHGYDDPVTPFTELCEFQEDLTKHKVDWQTHLFSHSMHAFTTPSANNPEKGIAYNPVSAERAWSQIRAFVDERFSGHR